MKQTVRLTVLLLVLCILATAVASCGGGGAPQGTTEEHPSETAAGTDREDPSGSEEQTSAAPVVIKTEPDLPELDYGGKEIRILVRPVDVCRKDLWLDTKDDTDEVDHAVWQRALYIESEYKAFITLVESSDGNYETDAMNSIQTGSCDFDIIAAHGRAASSYALHNCSYDWNQLRYVDLTCDWWSNGAVTDWAINGKNYMMTGDISTHYLRTAIAMYFNKDVFDLLSMSYPYSNVEDNTWTLETWKSLAMEAYNGMPKTGTGSLEDDFFAYTTGWWRGPMQLLYSTGHRVVTGNSADTFRLDLYDETTSAAYEAYIDGFLFAGSCNTEAPSDYARLQAAFRRNGAVFYDDTLDTSRLFKEMNFGILPWPKYDESVDEYYTTLSSYANCFVIPKTVADPDSVSVILEAMAYFGHKRIVPAYYDRVLSYKYSPDPESTDMLQIIRAGLVYDFGGIYSFGEIGDMGKLLYEAGTATGMYGLYSSLKSVAESKFSDWDYVK